MPPFVRLGCAGIAVITIAALTSVGLFALVAGRSPFGAPGGRAVANGAPVLVTIQALPVTPTVAPLATATDMPTSLIPALAAPPRPAPAAASPPATPAVTTPAALASPAPPFATPPVIAAAPERSATHDGLTLEVAEVDRRWQPASTEGAAPAREPTELLTIHLRFTNRSGEVRYVAESDVLLTIDDGARFAARQAGAHREPRLLTVPLASNDSLRGWLTFEIPPNTTVRGIQWSPTRPDRPRAEATYLIAIPQ